MKIRVGDNVAIIAGKDRGKTGMVTKTLKKEDRVIVEGINIVKKHMKPNNQEQTGGIVEMAAPIHVSNVKKIEATTKKETKKVEAKETTSKKESGSKPKTTKKDTKTVKKD